MAIKIGRWDCKQCGYIGNKGPVTRCEKCGASRPDNVSFYLADDSEIVTNANKIKEAKNGADWVCSFCSSHNKATHTICQSCGNDRDANDGDESLKEKIHLFKQKPKVKRKHFKIGKAFKRILLGIASFFVLFFILAMFNTDVKVTVSGFKWERSVEIESLRKLVEEDWIIPAGGHQIDAYQAVHHYKQIADGTETRTRIVQKQVGTEQVKVGVKDLGNGYFEDIYENKAVYEDVEETYTATKYKKLPVYKTKYKYSIFRWMDSDTIRAKDSVKFAYWPKDERLNDSTKFRIKNKTEKYLLMLNYEQKSYPEEVGFELWEETNLGDTLIATKSSVFGTFLGLKETKK